MLLSSLEQSRQDDSNEGPALFACLSGSALFACDPFTGFQVRMDLSTKHMALR